MLAYTLSSILSDTLSFYVLRESILYRPYSHPNACFLFFPKIGQEEGTHDYFPLTNTTTIIKRAGTIAYDLIFPTIFLHNFHSLFLGLSFSTKHRNTFDKDHNDFVDDQPIFLQLEIQILWICRRIIVVGMPLPWKKTRVARISRLMADLQSPKHGNSIVVQTGFPTSLVDLFVKNRDRLKKKKKRALASEISAADTVIVPPLLRQLAVFEIHSVIEGESLRAQQKENLEESLLEREDKIQVEERANGWDRRWLLGTGLKFFVVVVLALSTKKLTVGITASAFVLLFLEYFGKHFVWFLKHCFLSKRVEQCKDFKTPIAKDFKAISVKEDRRAVSTIGGIDSSEEIPVVEPNFRVATQVEEIMIKEPDFKLTDYLNVERAVEEDQDRCVLVLNREGSRRAKLKAKIKKIMPKKLPHGKKGKKKDERELESSSSGVFSSFDGEVEEAEIGDKQDLVVQGEPKLSPLEEKCTKKLEDRIQSLNIQLHTIGENGGVEEKLGIEKKGNSGYLFISLIVLSGLVGGRVVAVLLTVSGCLITKLARSSVCSSTWNLGWW